MHIYYVSIEVELWGGEDRTSCEELGGDKRENWGGKPFSHTVTQKESFVEERTSQRWGEEKWGGMDMNKAQWYML